MLPSPPSSQSSFRDYYNHTSEYSEDPSSSYITQGIRNFKLKKIFTKIDWKITQEAYWSLFYTFKKLAKKPNMMEMRNNGMRRILDIINKRGNRQSKTLAECVCIDELLADMQQKREKEIGKMIHFGLRWMARNYINLGVCYNKVRDRLGRKEKRSDKSMPAGHKKDKWKFTFKLSKACLSIITRNFAKKKMFNYLGQITYGYDRVIKSKGSLSQSSFSKPKGDNKYYQHKQNTKTVWESKLLQLVVIIDKKMYLLGRIFFTNLMRKGGDQITSAEDDPQIYTHVARHIIYLTGLQTQTQHQIEKKEKEQMKLFKLGEVLKKEARRRKRMGRQAILQWRGAANQQNIALRKEISKLEMIKQYYMDQL